MWEINNSLQLLSFARALILGIIICLIYDILRACRKIYNYSTVSIFLQDIIFSVIMAFSVFLFLLSVTNGEMRGFVLIGLALGFIFSRLSVSRLWFRFLKWLLSIIKYAFSWVSKSFYRGFDFLRKNILFFYEKSVKTLKNS